MLIEQIIKFELRWPRPPNRTCTPTTGYFHDKTKIFKENLRVDYYLHLKYLQKVMHLNSTYLGQITKFNTKIQDFKRVLGLHGK